jgi:hypothetical protein
MMATRTNTDPVLYEMISLTDKAESAESIFSDVTFVDVLKTPEEPSVAQAQQGPRKGSLSRSTVSSWYFIVHGAVDAALAVGPIFFFSTLDGFRSNSNSN